jgi:hypothetical protein
MNSSERFQKALHYEYVDRVPYFENEIRGEVISRWCREGLASAGQLRKEFPTDQYEEIEPQWGSLPPLNQEPDNQALLKKLRRRLNLYKPFQLLLHQFTMKRLGSQRQDIVMLVVHQGFFLALGVNDWKSFDVLIKHLRDNRQVVHDWMEIYGEFAAHLANKILSAVKVDAALFNEPIGGLTGPLISPAMYREIVLNSYQSVLNILAKYRVPIIIFRTYANACLLIPEVLKAGMNSLWAYESNSHEMDYRKLRREFGRDLRLIGGIDLDALRQGPEAIQREIEEKVPALLADGGYIPTADGRIREDVPFKNYVFYRELLRKYIHI